MIESPENQRKRRRAHLRKRSIIEKRVKILMRKREMNNIVDSFVMSATVDMPFHPNYPLKSMSNFMKRERILDALILDATEYFKTKINWRGMLSFIQEKNLMHVIFVARNLALSLTWRYIEGYIQVKNPTYASSQGVEEDLIKKLILVSMKRHITSNLPLPSKVAR